MRIVEGLGEHVDRALEGGQPLEQGEKSQGDRLDVDRRPCQLAVVGRYRLGEPRADVRLAPRTRRLELIETEVHHHPLEPSTLVVERGGLAVEPAYVRFLQHVLGFREAAQHPVGEREEPRAVCFEGVHNGETRQPVSL